jgi:hypothetical protein
LLAESALGSGIEVGILLFDESELVKAIEPAAAKEQLDKLETLALTYQSQSRGVLDARAAPSPLPSLAGVPKLLGERIGTFL